MGRPSDFMRREQRECCFALLVPRPAVQPKSPPLSQRELQTPSTAGARTLIGLCLEEEVQKKERKKTDNPREGWEDGTPPPHRDFLRRGECGASRRPPLGVCLFLSLFAVCRRFSLPPLCRPAVFLPSSFSLLSLLPLSRRSPLPRSAAPPSPVGPAVQCLGAQSTKNSPGGFQLHELSPALRRVQRLRRLH